MLEKKKKRNGCDRRRSLHSAGGALRRFILRKMSMAWEQWQYTAKQMARELYAVGGAVNRMLQRQLSMAFEKWQAEAAQMKEEKRKLSPEEKKMRRHAVYSVLFALSSVVAFVMFSPGMTMVVEMDDLIESDGAPASEEEAIEEN